MLFRYLASSGDPSGVDGGTIAASFHAFGQRCDHLLTSSKYHGRGGLKGIMETIERRVVGIKM